MLRFARGILALALGLVALIVIGIAGLVGWSAFSAPSPSGEARVAGLRASAEIVRDEQGTARIAAASPEDAWFALGYAHAQDRLFQMQLVRMVGRGRLAEWIGPPGVESDRFMRTLGLGHLAEAEVAAASPEVCAALDAYAAGVNSWIDGHGGPWPPEFVFLAATPERWQAEDSLVAAKLLGLMLTGNWTREALRGRIASSLGADEAELLLPAIHGGRSTIETAGSGASNIWALAGSRTTSGKPILANDPHLGLQIPGMWYLARLNAPGFEVTGATVPGIPFTLLGHNGRVAWGFTTTNGDASDLFIETVDPADPGRYLTPDGPRPFETRRETIRVRFAADEEIEIRTTRHGPVIGVPGASRVPLGQDQVLSLAHAALAPGDRTAHAFRAFSFARTTEEFRRALMDMHAPMQNAFFADVSGHIGFVAAGRIPVRKGGDGRLPARGADGRFDWAGWVPFTDLPQVADPPGGAIWNANNSVSPAGGRPFVGADYDLPYRADRIEALIAAVPRHDVSTSLAMQADVTSPMAVEVLPLLLGRLPERLGERSEWARIRLSAWDRRMVAEAPEPLVFVAWMRAIDRRLFAERLGTDFPAFWGLNPGVLMRVLSERPGACGPGDGDPCAGMLAAALDEALDDLATRFGEDRGNWTWGRAHQARLDHPLARRLPVVGGWFGRAVPTPGGEDTLLRGAMRLSDADAPFANVHASGYRAVYDLADLDRSRYAISTGQSGNPWSAFYDDLVVGWQAGRSFEIPSTPPARPRGIWRLAPAG